MRFFKMLLFAGAMAFMLALASGVNAKEIVIGFSGILSGPAAEYGQDCSTGVELAVKDLNAAGGIKVKGENYTFKLIKLDDMTDPTKAVNNARRLKEQDKAIAVFNAYFTTAVAIMKINQDKGNEFLSMIYTSVPQASRMGNKLAVIYTLPFTVYNQVFAERAWKMGWRKVGMMVTLGGYGDAWRAAFKSLWVKKGGTITADVPANYYKDTDFSTQLTAVLATKPDALLIGGPSPSTALVIEQARNLGFRGGLIIIDQARADAIAKLLKGSKKLENVIGIAQVVDIPSAGAKAFDKKYVATYNRPLTWESVINYNGMIALSKAIEAAGTTTDVYAIRAAFPKAFPMLANKYAAEVHGISGNGVFYIPGAIQSVKNGKFTTPLVFDFWSKTQAEFNKVKRTAKYYVPVQWYKFAE